MADDSKPGFYIEELNKFKQQHSGEVQYRELTDSPLLKKFRFALQVVIDGKEFPAAGGSNKKEAKNGAAKIALEILNAQVRSSFSPAAKLPSQGTGAGNHVGQLNTYAQKNGLQVLYDCEERSPQQFRVTCRINGKVYGRELAGSKQKAKQLAAQRALEKLHSEDTAARPQGPLAASIASSSESSSLLRSRELSTTESLSGRSSLDRNSCSESWASSQLASPECLPRLAEGAPPEAAAAAADKCPYTTERSFLEHFTDIKPIGKGGYGQVFKARHKIDGKTYVIKRVKYDNEKVKREVEALAELRHPNIVLYHDCWKGPDRLFRDYEWRPETECLFIKMEFCGQGTLDQWIDRMRHQKPDKTLALQFFKQIVEGVNYIHKKKYIHRDLKPSNIFLVDEKQIKIGDFGLVAALENDSKRTTGMGTRRYMSPEQIASTDYGNKVDIYALGIIYVELTHICKTSSEMAKIFSQLKEGEIPKEFSGRKKALLEQLLALDPSKRPSAQELLYTLRSWKDGAGSIEHRTC